MRECPLCVGWLRVSDSRHTNSPMASGDVTISNSRLFSYGQTPYEVLFSSPWEYTLRWNTYTRELFLCRLEFYWNLNVSRAMIHKQWQRKQWMIQVSKHSSHADLTRGTRRAQQKSFPQMNACNFHAWDEMCFLAVKKRIVPQLKFMRDQQELVDL